MKSIKYFIFDYDTKFSDNFDFDKLPISIQLLQETLKAYILGFVSS